MNVGENEESNISSITDSEEKNAVNSINKNGKRASSGSISSDIDSEANTKKKQKNWVFEDVNEWDGHT